MLEGYFSTLPQAPEAPRTTRRRTVQAGNRHHLRTNTLDPSSFSFCPFLLYSRPATLQSFYSSASRILDLERFSFFLLSLSATSLLSSLPLLFPPPSHYLLRRAQLRTSIPNTIFISQRCLLPRRILPFLPPSQQALP
jgi:hypothetical protein